MPTTLLEDVFKTSGVPTYTFVKPLEYQKLVVSLRTPGRGLVLEGPSGIGKTTGMSQALEELGMANQVLNLTARRADDRDIIVALPDMKAIGIVVIDDFHRLDDPTKQAIADYMKVLADEEDKASKVVIVGINKAGESLVKFAKDLSSRLETIRFETNPDELVSELIEKGEDALNVQISFRQQIAEDARGSFQIAQMLCHQACLMAEITERSEVKRSLDISFEAVRGRVLDGLSTTFFEEARKFARGTKLRQQGRAPYLHILYWLAESDEWSLRLDLAMAQHPLQKGSVGQVVEKGWLQNNIHQDAELSALLHFDPATRVLSVEDPRFVYFIRGLNWNNFARRVGFLNINFESRYDFALSFAGADRSVAEAIADSLLEEEVEVFYDKNEQYRILAKDVQDYLAPIYRSDAQYVVALLGPEYPKRVWTKFESDHFKDPAC